MSARLFRDDRRGHFVMELDSHDGARAEVVGADLGRTLALTTSGAYLTAEDARTLAESLTWWADRKHDDSDDMERHVELNDLFDLLESEAAR